MWENGKGIRYTLRKRRRKEEGRSFEVDEIRRRPALDGSNGLLRVLRREAVAARDCTYLYQAMIHSQYRHDTTLQQEMQYRKDNRLYTFPNQVKLALIISDISFPL